MLTLLVVVAVAGILFLAAVVATQDGTVLHEAAPDHPDVTLPPGRVVAEDLRDVRFGMVVRGYRMSEVDDVLERLGEELAERDERIADLERALAEIVEPVVTEVETRHAPTPPGPNEAVAMPPVAPPPAATIEVAAEEAVLSGAEEPAEAEAPRPVGLEKEVPPAASTADAATAFRIPVISELQPVVPAAEEAAEPFGAESLVEEPEAADPSHAEAADDSEAGIPVESAADVATREPAEAAAAATVADPPSEVADAAAAQDQSGATDGSAATDETTEDEATGPREEPSQEPADASELEPLTLVRGGATGDADGVAAEGATGTDTEAEAAATPASELAPEERGVVRGHAAPAVPAAEQDEDDFGFPEVLSAEPEDRPRSDEP